MNRYDLFRKALYFLCLFILFSPMGCADDDESQSGPGQVREDDPSASSGQASDDDGADDDAADDDDAVPAAFYAGFARVDITPDTSLQMAGYGSFFLFDAFCRWSEGVHDPIYANASAFEDADGDAVILLVLDTVGTITNEVKEIQQGIAAATGIAEKSIVVASTHQHHGPDTIGLWGLLVPPESGRDEDYIDWMVEQAIQAGLSAWNGRVAATLEYAVGEESRYHWNQNTRDENRALDSAMTVLAAYDSDGGYLGSLMNWAAHPTVMGHYNRKFSADYPGVYYEIMDGDAGGVNLFVNGPIAAIQPYDPETGGLFEDATWDDVALVGQALSETALGLLDQAIPIEDPDIWLVETREVNALVENLLFWLASVFQVIPRDVPPVGQEGITCMSTFAVGPVTFGTMPGEYIPDYGFAIREVMGGEAQFLIGLGMDWIGYAVTPEQYTQLAYIYEWFLCPSRYAGEELMEVYHAIWDPVYSEKTSLP